MFYTTAWCTSHEEDFRKAIPLEILGASMRLHGSAAAFAIVMLEGMERLSPGYIRTLESIGFTVIDHGAAFRSIIGDYPAIDRFYNRYERNCLLRWIALKQLSTLDLEPGRSQTDEHSSFSPCHHLDSDLILHTSLDELAADTAGKTFMLQGCPVLISIADPRWFDQYEENLKALNEDITGYSARAFAEKQECLRRDPELANQSLYRNPIGSDQDLLEYLVSSGKIIQTAAATIFDSKYYFIQNPLSMNIWHAAQETAGNARSLKDDTRFPKGYPRFSKGYPRFSINERSQIFIGSRALPFTHFQNTFARYAGVYLVTRQLHFPRSLARRILRYSIRDEQFHTCLLYKLIAKLNNLRAFSRHRETIMREMMQPGRMRSNQAPRLIALLNLLLDFQPELPPGTRKQ